MYTAMFALPVAIITGIGMAFYALPVHIASIVLVAAIAVGGVIDQIRARRRSKSDAS
jgi:hypothetical protein